MKITLKLPYGSGSMQKRGRTYWLMYTNPAGVRMQENSQTDDPMLAIAMLTERALEVAEAKVATLKVIDEAAKKARASEAEAGGQTNDGRKRRAGGRSIQDDASVVRNRKGAKS